METPHNIVLPSTPSVLQSNTFLLTNDGNLVQLPILNSSSTVYDPNPNLLTQTAIVRPNTGLLTPIVINKPSPVIVLQKPAPQIIQTAQILNAAPQVISVSKPNVQILNSSIIYTSSNPVANSKILSHILSKAPANKKRIMRDSTTTTYVNKIPIPALSKQSYAKKNISNNVGNEKNKSNANKSKETTDKQTDEENKKNENQTPDQVLKDTDESKNNKTQEKEKKSSVENELESTRKRNLEDEKKESCKKAKLKNNAGDNVFKPIENPIETDAMFCNLGLPNSINTSLSISPTAAFLSSFPIVAPIRPETDEDLGEKKVDDNKSLRQIENHLTPLEQNEERNIVNNQERKSNASKDFLTQSAEEQSVTQENISKEKGNNLGDVELKLISDSAVNNNFDNNITANSNLTNGNNNTGHGNNSESNSNCSISTSVHNSNNKNNNETQIQNQPNNNNHFDPCKSWAQYQQNTCDIRPETFFLPADNIQIGQALTSIEGSSGVDLNFPGINTNLNNATYKSYGSSAISKSNNNSNIQNMVHDIPNIKNNTFEYGQKENFMNQAPSYNNERSTAHKKSCSNNVGEPFVGNKAQQPTNYTLDTNPPYQLVPAKEVPNQRNARTVNWMTEPDVRNRNMIYGSQNDKIPALKPPIYAQSDNNFYTNGQNAKLIGGDCTEQFITVDQSKMINYHKNDFYGKDQRCKPMDKRTDGKCYVKPTQNSYNNIFDYNYTPNCFTEEDSSKYCNNGQSSCVGKSKKNNNGSTGQKKKSEGMNNEHHGGGGEVVVESTKKPPEQIITNLDFNPIPNQECFTWMPGKNVDWLAGKSFGLDNNLVVPSTLPTLVGDLALGTSTNDIHLVKNNVNSKIGGIHSNLKTLPNDIDKEYAELGIGNNVNLGKPFVDGGVSDGSKQYLEPFANLSKNIFDMTPSNVQNNNNNTQVPKNDFTLNNNETIVLKNIFELPVSKSSSSATTATTTDFNRQKQRNISNNTQNSFLSVSQLVEPPSFEGTAKLDSGLDTGGTKTEIYGQNYTNFNNQKTYKSSKSRSSHCKYGDRKYQGYKNSGSSNYTAEALIRSNNNNNNNSNVGCQSNDFAVDININYLNGKTSQKIEQFTNGGKTDFDISGKSGDFQSGSNQNIYTDFNFSSPVPNFGIGSTTVGNAGEFAGHDPNSNFPGQSHTFFTDFITPEYPLTENPSNSLLIPPSLQNSFVVEKKPSHSTNEKTKNNSKHYLSRNRKNFDCPKSSFNEFSIPPSNAIFTSTTLACPPPTIFTTSACSNLLPVPTQSIPISFSSPPSFTTSNISFPPLTTMTTTTTTSSTSNNVNYHKFTNSSTQNSTPSSSFLPNNAGMFTTCTSKPNSSITECFPTNSLGSVTNAVISSAFSASNVPFSTSQSSISFFSLSNPIIPSSSLPSSTSNSLANFNLSTIFPEINQKGNYHYS